LAGQHADYLKTQLWALNFALRESDTMHQNADKLSSDQIDALVSYLAGD
jgi:cytochrome c553